MNELHRVTGSNMTPRALPPADTTVTGHGYGPGMVVEERESVPFVDFLRQLNRRKWALILIATAGIAAALAVSLAQKPSYKAVTSVEIQGVNEDFLNLRGVSATARPVTEPPESDVHTQAELLKEDALLENVLTQLRFQQHPDFRLGPDYLAGAKRLLGISAKPTETDMAHALKVAKEYLSVEPSRQGRIIRIEYSSHDPKLAADFPNVLAQTLVQQRLEARWKATEQVAEWLQPELKDLRTKVETSEAALQEYARNSGLLFAVDGESVAEKKLRDVQEELSRARADRIAKQSFYETTSGGSPGSPSTALVNSVLSEYQVRLTELRRQLAELSAVLKPTNYKVVQLRAQIAEVESALKEEYTRALERIRSEYAAARSREALLDDAYRRQAGLVSAQGIKRIEYNNLKREAEINRQLYESMLQKVKEAGVATAIRPSNIRIVSPAKPPSLPYKPNFALNLGIGLAAGLTLGIGYVLAQAQRDQRLHGPGEAEFYLQLPELGTIPRARELSRAPAKGLLTALSQEPGRVELVTWENTASGVSECFRATLTSILSAARDNSQAKVLVVTSPLPTEGKTTVASNLAIALAEISRRVLLVEGDLRKPQLQKVFGIQNGSGLTDLLTHDGPLEEDALGEFVHKTGVPSLYLLSSGHHVDRTGTVLYSPRLAQIMNRFRYRFDHVIIDAPPCLLFADARIMARSADGVVLVLRANQTSWTAALAAAQRLQMDGVRVLGTVLNDWSPSKGADPYGYRQARKYYEAGV